MADLRTAQQVAIARSEFYVPEDPDFAILKANFNCEGLHNPAGYALEGVKEHIVSQMVVRLYPPGIGKAYMRGDGFVDPLEIVRSAGCYIDRQVCLHRNTNTGWYMVFQREQL